MRQNAGFTLLEMLAALVILAFCSTVLLQGFSASQRTLQHTRLNEQLAQAARSVLAQQRTQTLRAGLQQGEWSGQIQWRLKVTAQPGHDQGTARLMRLDLWVSKQGITQHYTSLDVASGLVQR